MVAVAGARGAEFSIDGAFEVVDGALGPGLLVYVAGGIKVEVRIYPVVDGRLWRHPGLPDSRAMLEDHGCIGCKQGFLLVWFVEPEEGRSFRERRRCFHEAVDDCPEGFALVVAPSIQLLIDVEFTLLLCIAIGVVEAPNLRDKGAQIVVVWVVLPGSPVGRPGEFTTQGTHASVSIRIHNPTTTHDATFAFRSAALMNMAMAVWLGRSGGGESGKGKKD